MDQVKADIEAVLRSMTERYAAMDPDGVLAYFADDESMVVGTGADEVRFGLGAIRTQVERDMAQADSISIELGDVNVKIAGDAAFAYTDAAFAGSAGGEDFRLPVRLTVGLVKSAAGWRIVQFHTSVAFGAQADGESFPT